MASNRQPFSGAQFGVSKYKSLIHIKAWVASYRLRLMPKPLGRKQMYKIFLIFVCSLLLFSFQKQNEVNTIPELGDDMPCTPPDSIYYGISSSQFARGCKITPGGLTFFVATIDNKTIRYISTTDSNFTTPEGIHVGCKYSDVIKAKGSRIREERGWACYSKLPSGWYAQ